MAEIRIDKLFRSRRRTIVLEVTQDAKLVVRAPIHVSLEDIQNMLFKKANWISEKKNLAQQRKVQRQPKKFISGESFYYLGKPYRFKLTDGDMIRLSEDLEFPKTFISDAQEHLIQWYKNLAYEKIKERVTRYSNIIGLPYSTIKVSNAQKRLGSCSVRGCLNFSWRLIIAPLEIIDYIVVHELIHLEVRNHSANFWSKVRLVLPNYATHVNWLKDHEYLLHICG